MLKKNAAEVVDVQHVAELETALNGYVKGLTGEFKVEVEGEELVITADDAGKLVHEAVVAETALGQNSHQFDVTLLADAIIIGFEDLEVSYVDGVCHLDPTDEWWSNI